MQYPEGASVVSIDNEGILLKCADGSRCYVHELDQPKKKSKPKKAAVELPEPSSEDDNKEE